MGLFAIILLSWIVSGWIAGSIFTYLDVRLAGHEIMPVDILYGILVIGGLLGPVVFYFILRDLRTFYPFYPFSKPRGK